MKRKFYVVGMESKRSHIVGNEASPPCKIINEVPETPIQALCNKYPMGVSVNTEKGRKGYQVEKDSTEFPEHVLPKGDTL